MRHFLSYVHPQHVTDAALATMYVSSLGGLTQLIGVLFPALYFGVKTWESDTVQRMVQRWIKEKSKSP